MLRKEVFPNISTIKGRRFFKSVARFIVCPLPLCERREGLFFEMWENSKTKYKIAKKNNSGICRVYVASRIYATFATIPPIVAPFGYRVGQPPTQTRKATQRANLSVSGIGYPSQRVYATSRVYVGYRVAWSQTHTPPPYPPFF